MYIEKDDSDESETISDHDNMNDIHNNNEIICHRGNGVGKNDIIRADASNISNNNDINTISNHDHSNCENTMAVIIAGDASYHDR